jgi:nucleotide-binding universal stress UspA family protein
MVQRILVATDGSPLSRRAVRAAAGLARSLGARLSVIHVVSPYLESTGIDLAKLPGFGRAVEKSARAPLEAARAEARRQDVNAEAVSVVGGEPWKGILRAAQARRCDLVVMASHGRRGLAGLILGSETAKVLAHSKVPVLVCR